MARSSIPSTTVKAGHGWWRRIGWLIVFWLVGVGVVALIALVFRGVMGAVGLTR